MFLSKTEIQGKTYLKLPVKPDDIIGYQLEMLVSHPEIFIPVIYKEQLLFETTGLMPITEHLKSIGVDYVGLKSVIMALVDYLNLCQEYLLEPTRLVVEADYIYYDLAHDRYKLMYLPCYTYSIDHLQGQMKKMVIQMMYTIFSMKRIAKDAKLKSLIDHLQRDDYDLIALRGQLALKTSSGEKKPGFLKRHLHRKVTPAEATIQLQEYKPKLVYGRRSVVVGKTPFILGRSERLCDLSLPEALTIGRIHAEIIIHENRYFLRDLDSKNGTVLNGIVLKKGEQCLLATGDIIGLGQEEIQFE